MLVRDAMKSLCEVYVNNDLDGMFFLDKLLVDLATAYADKNDDDDYSEDTAEAHDKVALLANLL